MSLGALGPWVPITRCDSRLRVVRVCVEYLVLVEACAFGAGAPSHRCPVHVSRLYAVVAWKPASLPTAAGV